MLCVERMDATPIPFDVERDIGPAIAELRAAGWSVTAASYDANCFDDWYLDLVRRRVAIRLKDRSQYMIEGPGEQLKAAGLCKVFEDVADFRRAVVAWATEPPSA